MTQSQFKAILAHEYGHFSNRDTAGGNLARQVRISIHTFAYNLAMSRQAHWLNPAWLFVNGFYRIFLRITLGASRLQEILADRYAAVAYGARNFTEGLTHIVRQSLTFEMQVNREISVAQAQRHGFISNLYALPPIAHATTRELLDKKIEEAMSRPTSPYDSHPAVRDRIALVHQLPGVGGGENNQALVLDLLQDVEALQNEMTARVRENLRQQRAA